MYQQNVCAKGWSLELIFMHSLVSSHPIGGSSETHTPATTIAETVTGIWNRHHIQLKIERIGDCNDNDDDYDDADSLTLRIPTRSNSSKVGWFLTCLTNNNIERWRACAC